MYLYTYAFYHNRGTLDDIAQIFSLHFPIRNPGFLTDPSGPPWVKESSKKEQARFERLKARTARSQMLWIFASHWYDFLQLLKSFLDWLFDKNL